MIVENYGVVILMLVLLQNFSFNAIATYKKTNSFLRSDRVVVMSNKHHITKNRKKIRFVTRHTKDDRLFKLVHHIEPDYLPYKNAASNKLYTKGIVDRYHKFDYQVRGSKLILSWHGKKIKDKLLPVVMYHQSRLIVNGKNKTNCRKNNIMQPLVKQKKGINTASLEFIIPFWYKALLALTILSWVIFLSKVKYYQ